MGWQRCGCDAGHRSTVRRQCSLRLQVERVDTKMRDVTVILKANPLKESLTRGGSIARDLGNTRPGYILEDSRETTTLNTRGKGGHAN